MSLIDTHAHLHFEQYKDTLDEVLSRAKAAAVNKIISVGINDLDSTAAVDFASSHQNVFASAGLHPHEASKGDTAIPAIKELARKADVVAIGECGLDYYRNLSPHEDQEKVLRQQIELAQELKLPLIFHLRDAYEDFKRIVSDYDGLRAVIHSFSADSKTASWLVEKGFTIGLNGIMTFTKDPAQLEAAKLIPLSQLVLETDSPFLAPAPNRGEVNEPAGVKIVGEFLAELRGESFDKLAATTTTNAEKLFLI